MLCGSWPILAGSVPVSRARDSLVSLSVRGRAADRRPWRFAEGEEPSVLRLRDDASKQEWTVPVIDAAGRVAWQAPRFDTYADALAALLDFPIRPAEAAGEDEDDPDGGGGFTGGAGETHVEEDVKGYALHSAAELIESVSALQRSLPQSMLDDWLDHVDRMFHSAFPKSLVNTWREYHIDIFTHLREPELRPQEMTDKQKSQYFDILDRTAAAWSLR